MSTEAVLLEERLLVAKEKYEKAKTEREEIVAVARQLRDDHGYSLGRLADLLEVTRQSVSKMLKES